MDTLRLSQEDKHKLVAFVESQGRVVSDSRRRLRVDFHGRKVFGRMSVGEELGPLCALVPRNLSACGFAFVHGVFVNTGMRCRLTLPMMGNRWCQVDGVVRRCRHIQGIVHEVSVVFDEEIDLADIVPLTPEQRRRVETEALGGVADPPPMPTGVKPIVMLVDPDPASRTLRASSFHSLGWEVAASSSNHAAREWLAACAEDRRPAAAVLAGAAGAERAGVAELRFDPVALASHLRGAGLPGPILLCVDAADVGFLRRAALAGVTALPGRQMEPSGLAEAVNSHFHLVTLAGPEVPLLSLLAGHPHAAESIEAFAQHVPGFRQRLRRPGTERQPDALVPICEELLVQSVAAGYPEASARAWALRASLSGHDEHTVRDAIEALDRALGRVPGQAGNEAVREAA